MITQDAVNRVYLLATGKNTSLDITSTKGAKILGYLNHFSEEFAQADWSSMRSLFTLTPTITATDTFSFSDLSTLHHPSQQEGDYVRIYHTDGVGETDYTIVPIERLYDSGPIRNNGGSRTVALKGKTLIFSTAFLLTNPQYGGSIKLPGYLVPNTLANASDVIQVDDPHWVIQASAAQYVLTDRTRVQLYDTLKAKADDLWYSMMQNNESQQESVYVTQLMPRTGGAFDW